MDQSIDEMPLDKFHELEKKIDATKKKMAEKELLSAVDNLPTVAQRLGKSVNEAARMVRERHKAALRPSASASNCFSMHL